MLAGSNTILVPENLSAQEQVFHQNSAPSDQMAQVFQALNSLCMAIQNIEKRFQELMD